MIEDNDHKNRDIFIANPEENDDSKRINSLLQNSIFHEDQLNDDQRKWINQKLFDREVKYFTDIDSLISLNALFLNTSNEVALSKYIAKARSYLSLEGVTSLRRYLAVRKTRNSANQIGRQQIQTKVNIEIYKEIQEFMREKKIATYEQFMITAIKKLNKK